MKNIPDEKVLRYISEIHGYYTKLRFGNAVDTKNVELIKEDVYKRQAISIPVNMCQKFRIKNMIW